VSLAPVARKDRPDAIRDAREREELAPFAAPERVAVAPDEQHEITFRERRDREVIGPGIARGDNRRRGRSGRQRLQHRRVGNFLAGRSDRDVAFEEGGPVGGELVAHALDEALQELVTRLCARQVLDGFQRVEPWVGKRRDLAPLLDRRAVDLLDLAHEQCDQIAVGQHHRELVDRDVVAAFQHIDADEVAADRADAGGDETERTRSVGKPDAHDETRHAGEVTTGGRGWRSPQHCVHKPFSYTRRVERLGLLGGTFDPVHVAHLAAAAAARDQLELSLVLIVVAGDPWQKRGRVGASAQARLEMVAAAIDGVSGLEVSRLEIDRAGPTYTIDTVETLRGDDPDGEVFLIVGSDVAASIETWHRVDDLRSAVTLAIVDREDVAPSTPPPGWKCERVHMPRLDVSSTDLRRRIAAGESVDFLVPPPAARVLRARGLYTGG
jgi:nicotinate-nucleotide adenylyltransferase